MPHEIRDSLQRDIQMLSLRIDTVNNIQSNYSDRIDALERQAEENNNEQETALKGLVLTLAKKQKSVEGPGPLVALIKEHSLMLSSVAVLHLQDRVRRLSKLVKNIS